MGQLFELAAQQTDGCLLVQECRHDATVAAALRDESVHVGGDRQPIAPQSPSRLRPRAHRCSDGKLFRGRIGPRLALTRHQELHGASIST